MKKIALCLFAVATLVTFKGYACDEKETTEQTVLENIVACRQC